MVLALADAEVRSRRPSLRLHAGIVEAQRARRDLLLDYYVMRGTVQFMVRGTNGSTTSPETTTQLLKGVLDLAVQAVLRTGDAYGYDVVRRLRDAGLGDVGDASVYGTLRRLYSGGALTSYVVASEEGPHRKYYGLTPAGRDRFKREADTWRAFALAMDGLLHEAEGAR
jgi:PadR family transcriptional regulator, regulatory protein PadR